MNENRSVVHFSLGDVMSPTTLALAPIEHLQAVEPTPSLLGAFLAGRNPRTLRAYRSDLEDFTRWLGAVDVDTAARTLLARGAGTANALVLSYRANLSDRQLAAATINRRLAALRSLVQLARTIGLVPWTLAVPGLKTEAYRDTAGPGVKGVRRLLHAAGTRADAKGTRDTAILRLLFDLGLRRAEVVALDVSDVDLASGTVMVLGKGRTDKDRLSLPEPTATALRAWLVIRGSGPGPLFRNVDRARKGERLTGTSIHRIVRALGAAEGLTVRPHGLRHAAITAALDLTGDLRAVQRFSRHRDVRTLTIYDDNRHDLGGDVARRVAAQA